MEEASRATKIVRYWIERWLRRGHQGTLFLDEIGEISLEVQGKATPRSAGS